MQNRQKHVADRVRTFVKTEVFRRIKFINSENMFKQAIKLVMDRENVPDQQRGQFQTLKVIFVLWCGEYGLDELGTQKYLYLVIEFRFPNCEIKLKMQEMN